jgi:hypothetical protein
MGKVNKATIITHVLVFALGMAIGLYVMRMLTPSAATLTPSRIAPQYQQHTQIQTSSAAYDGVDPANDGAEVAAAGPPPPAAAAVNTTAVVDVDIDDDDDDDDVDGGEDADK